MSTGWDRLQHHSDVENAKPDNGDVFSYNATFRRWEFVAPDQNIDGGKADSVYTPPQLVDGGGA